MTRQLTHDAGLVSSAAAAGMIASLSLIAIPAVVLAPGPLATKQWSTLFALGKTICPPFAALAALLFGGLAYTGRGASRTWYTAASLLNIAIVPFTILFMGKTNGLLLGMAHQAAPIALSVSSTIQQWAYLNLGRAGLLFGGILCAFRARY